MMVVESKLLTSEAATRSTMNQTKKSQNFIIDAITVCNFFSLIAIY